ncbi:hypothetical protein B0A55_12378 [Friedmanniomyces simplex]|uniref:F-box domain-containing protein n=1 Tax=Friedmanniomyces simplex TaxID=329884 RepID=A0A4V6WKL7_9PEZI|nr:hypothetical protein B0A55_12378 [Friedmanniomyces simplex]
MAAMAQPSPRRLLALPPELRNQIYEFVFSFAKDSKCPTDLLSAAPPSKAPPLTCKTINSEAALLYKYEYRQYWSATNFELTVPPSPSVAVWGAIRSLAAEDCEHITQVKVVEYRSALGGARENTYLGGALSWEADVGICEERLTLTHVVEDLDGGRGPLLFGISSEQGYSKQQTLASGGEERGEE